MARTLADGVLAILLAPTCAACDRPLEEPSTSNVCAECWGSVRALAPPLCGACGDPLPSWHSGAPEDRCARCRAAATCIVRGRAVGAYDGPLRSMLHALKYDGRRSIAKPLGVLMRTHGAWVLEGAHCCVPVPLHWRRRWRRGFNQADDLAAGLPLPLAHALIRRQPTRSQAELNAAERRANVRRAFRVRRDADIRHACVVIVDDVSTTGATLEACARVLLEAGAREVRTLTAARVVTQLPHAHLR